MYLLPLHLLRQHPPTERYLCHIHSFFKSLIRNHFRVPWFSLTTNLTWTLQYFLLLVYKGRDLFSLALCYIPSSRHILRHSRNTHQADEWINEIPNSIADFDKPRMWPVSLSAKSKNDRSRFQKLEVWDAGAHFGFLRTKGAGTINNPKKGCDPCPHLGRSTSHDLIPDSLVPKPRCWTTALPAFSVQVGRRLVLFFAVEASWAAHWVSLHICSGSRLSNQSCGYHIFSAYFPQLAFLPSTLSKIQGWRWVALSGSCWLHAQDLALGCPFPISFGLLVSE